MAVRDIVREVDSVMDLMPETIDSSGASNSSFNSSFETAATVGTVVEASSTAADSLVEVTMETFTTAIDMEDIITPRGLTSGAMGEALQ